MTIQPTVMTAYRMQTAFASEDVAPEPAATDLMCMLDGIPEVDLPLKSLIPAFHLRQAGTDPSHVRLLADAAVSMKLPPILVQKRGSRIIDGLHRYEVAKLRGQWTINARLVDCTDAEALILAVKTNTLHGLPLSRSDRIASAKRILASHPDWSDRSIATVTALSARAIASLRNSSTDESQRNVKRLGRDGKRRPVATGEGRRRAAEYMQAHPEASLRQVARETDVSLGTAHDVREKIRSGVLPPPEPAPETAVAAVPEAADNGPSRVVPAHRAQPREIATVQQLTWPAISGKLTGDPALRYTEGGRAFLRWMATHSMHADEWNEFADAVPRHWLTDVARIAAGMSEEWAHFADRLRYRQDEVAS
jgi:hypothetical protein